MKKVCIVLLLVCGTSTVWAHDEHCEAGCTEDHSRLTVGRILEEAATHGHFQYGPGPLYAKTLGPAAVLALLLTLRTKLRNR